MSGTLSSPRAVSSERTSSDSWNAVRGPTRVQHRWLRFSFLVWAAFLLMPAVSSGQIPGEPDDTVVDSPPQMICMGNSLKAMRDDYLVPHLLARHGVTRLRFSRVVSANGSDIYLGAIRIEGDPAPLGLGNGPLLPSTSIARWGYLHQDNSAPPDLAEDTFVMQQYPANSSRRSVPIIGSVQELDLLIQVCDWMEEGATPTQLLPMRQWLDQPDTRIQQLHSWRQGNRVHLLLTGREEPLNGISTRWRTEISWQPTTLGGFLDLEVQP